MHIDHDAFASMSPLQRPKIWQQLTPENKFELMTTQWRLFLEGNRERMSAEQARLIEESLAELRPEDYRRPRSTESRDRARRTEERFSELFSVEELRRLHFPSMHSGEIPNRIARILVLTKPTIDESSVEGLMAALYALATLPPEQVRERHPRLPEILGAAFEGMPAGEEFWNLLSDEDVPLAALRAYSLLRSARIRNPIALSFRKQKPGPDSEDAAKLQSALHDLSTLKPEELRSRRYGDDDLPTILGPAFDDMPAGEEFWNAVDDEDVRLLANKMRVIIEMQQSGELPPPGSRR